MGRVTWAGVAGRRRSEIVGYVDHAGGGLMRGWAADLRSPRSRLALDVFRHGVFLGCARTGGLRPDLRSQGIGDGRCGFVFHSAALAEACATDGLRVVAPDLARTHLVVGADRSPAARTPPAPNADDYDGRRQLVLPLIESLAASLDGPPPSEEPWSCVGARRADILIRSDVRMGSSAFAAHVATKYGRAPAATDRGFWRWYLEAYAIEQAGRIPLSFDDMTCVARVWMPANDAEGNPRFRSRRRDAHAYAWAVHESRRLGLEDCLVTDTGAEALADIPWPARWTAFPLSRFMRMLRREHSLLHEIAVGTVSGRITLYAVLMILALREVHYLRYMPAVWVDRMLQGTRNGSLFARSQKAMLGTSVPVLSPARYRMHVASMDFDLSARRFTTSGHDGHRTAVPGHSAEIVDVQMIGPFRQSLGLAESCRRVARAFQASGLAVNFVDYRIGNPSVRPPSEIVLGDARVARINILHLNAEEVPEAMAYCSGAISGRRTVLIPYWELNRPAAAHCLGLELVEEVWCASRFLTEVFAGPKPTVHIGMSYDDRFDPAERQPNRRFTILTISDALSWTQRKNIAGAIDAFQAAFADADTRLIVKTRNAQAALSTAQAEDWRQILARCEGDQRITLIDEELPPAQQQALLAEADCLLSLHRAEGLGLDILDALHLGTPVVATAYSGNMDVCNSETAWLVDCDLVPVAAESYAFVEPGHVWAEPRLASAVAALRAVRSAPAARARKIAAARAFVDAQSSPDAFAARLSCLLRERLGARGRAPDAAAVAAAPTL